MDRDGSSCDVHSLICDVVPRIQRQYNIGLINPVGSYYAFNYLFNQNIIPIYVYIYIYYTYI
ncbi:hypothetical protein PUN28_001750 [Cardiocondyla obscurior]|uniref:Uncharacterized protein n=1 Tax=Cardiocondyla obscurior TaxID=286306 RepID=A0AAW2GR26_9HYME